MVAALLKIRCLVTCLNGNRLNECRLWIEILGNIEYYKRYANSAYLVDKFIHATD